MPEYGIRAALTGQTTLEHNHFAYALRAGAQVADAVIVANDSDIPLTFTVHGADLVSTQGGGVAPPPEGATAHRVGTWIRVANPRLTVAAHAEQRDPFVVSVPSGLPPGDFLGAVVVAKATAPGPGLRVATRAALIVKVTIPGQVRLSLGLGALTAVRQGDEERFSLDVSNSGNVLATIGGMVTVRDSGGATVATLPLSPQGIYVIPGGRATLQATWHGLPARGELTAVASVRGVADGAPPRTYTSNTLHLGFFPWGLVIGLGAALLALLLLLLGLLLRRRGLSLGAARGWRPAWWAGARPGTGDAGSA